MTWLYADIGDLALKITAVGSPPGFEGILGNNSWGFKEKLEASGASWKLEGLA